MAVPGRERVAVRRLRARAGRSDAVAARLRTERALAGVELRPRGLAPGAVLLVRALRARIGEAPAALEDLLRSASRPAREAVPAASNAVLFSSRAELLACLAGDVCSGVAAGRWWWTLVAPDTTPSGAVQVWIETAEAVPAAFAILATRGTAVEVASTFGEAQAEKLAAAVARVHGVATHVAAPVRPFTQGERDADRPGSAGDSAPEADSSALKPAQANLLRLSLTLARAPAALRMEAAAPARADPLHGGPPPSSVGAGREQPRHRQREQPRRASSGAHPPQRAPASPEPAARESLQPSKAAPRGPGHPEAPAIAADVEPRAVPPVAATPASVDDALAETPPTTPRDEPATLPDAEQVVGPPAAPFAPSDLEEPVPLAWRPPVATGLGGLLFLVGVAQRLGLYADFTEPAAPGLALDPWRFVALVGAALVDLEHQREDPIWALLAELARGDDERLPSDELDLHTASVREWLETNVELTPPEMLERPALVYADDTRVDAVFALVGHPIELRLAGIDIDPGWIPAAGRGLYFHFE
ncbi:MAG: hypothetical protein QOH95_617 [Gaiellaceae bacterium]|nr:hypothetical protein [Gaiellaceae bacterium]